MGLLCEAVGGFQHWQFLLLLSDGLNLVVQICLLNYMDNALNVAFEKQKD